jgi:membrane protease YdiL (CAAX protease family)
MMRVLAGKDGPKMLRKRVRRLRIGWVWYLVTLLGIPAVFVAALLVQPGALESFQGVTLRVVVSYPIYFVIVFFGGGPLGEEIGWRGFALPRMQQRYGALGGTLLLGVLWTCWHLPDFLTASKGGGPGTDFSTFLLNFAVFFLMVTSLAVILTWIFNHTHGSLFGVLLAHTSVNTPELTIVPLFPALDMLALHRAGLIAYVVPAVLILLLTRGKLGYGPRRTPIYCRPGLNPRRHAARVRASQSTPSIKPGRMSCPGFVLIMARALTPALKSTVSISK